MKYTLWIVVLNTQNLKLVGVDLCRPDLLTAVLEAVGIDFSLPTLILSEVVLTYLPPARYRHVNYDVVYYVQSESVLATNDTASSPCQLYSLMLA